MVLGSSCDGHVTSDGAQIPWAIEVCSTKVLATIWDVMRRSMGHGQEWSGSIGEACGAWEGRIGVNPGSTRWRISGGT